MLRYKTETRPGLVALYDILPGNGAGQFLQPRSPHGAITSAALRYGICSEGISQFYLHTHAVQSAVRMSHNCLCLPSYSWYSFTDPGWMES